MATRCHPTSCYTWPNETYVPSLTHVDVCGPPSLLCSGAQVAMRSAPSNELMLDESMSWERCLTLFDKRRSENLAISTAIQNRDKSSLLASNVGHQSPWMQNWSWTRYESAAGPATGRSHIKVTTKRHSVPCSAKLQQTVENGIDEIFWSVKSNLVSVLLDIY